MGGGSFDLLPADLWLRLEVDADVEHSVEEIQGILPISWLTFAYEVLEQCVAGDRVCNILRLRQDDPAISIGSDGRVWSVSMREERHNGDVSLKGKQLLSVVDLSMSATRLFGC